MYIVILTVFCFQLFIQSTLSQYTNYGTNPNLGYAEMNTPYGPNYGYAPSPGLTPGYGPGIGMNPYNAEMALEMATELGGYSGTGVGDIAVFGDMPVIGNTLVAGQVPIIGSVRFGGDVPAAGVVSVYGSCGCGYNGLV